MNSLNQSLGGRTLRIALAVLVFSILAFAVAFAPDGRAAAIPVDAAAGAWQAHMEGVPAVTLALERDSKGIKGVLVFYAIRDDGSGPAVVGKNELPLVDTRFHGDTMTFGADVNNRIIQFEVRFLSDREAEFRRFAGEDAPVRLVKK